MAELKMLPVESVQAAWSTAPVLERFKVRVYGLGLEFRV